MAPTPHLLACPYLMQVLDAIGATWGRSRLMRLSGAAEVTPHVDTDYYWRDHMRVHVPIVTQPTVRFLCGGETGEHGRRRVLDLRHLEPAQRPQRRHPGAHPPRRRHGGRTRA